MTEFYTDIGEIALDAVSDKYVGGPSFTGSRASGGDPSTDPTVGALSARTIYFIPVTAESFRTAFPDVQLSSTPWFGYAALGTDIRSGDVYTDGTLTYLITGKPSNWTGCVVAPASQVTM